ncbi:hypothetical protein [Alkalicoccobacillus murimartini]|uniref:ABC transporter periplasmic binding protein yphF n=1 Tax=Alkalicoccobacillus murimartini TaxID=171685 RepID=A0ABT9YDI2_9BACI|nr:hypothetical protein [Alkalicoccobacillus murimartini]MDQ0205908.1 hypothetical protein [Alkalicoccobacillus murimartini]
MKRIILKALFLGCVVVLAGCFYPQGERQASQVAYLDQLASVQTAVDAFQDDTGVLPIQTFDENTPTYQRYVIDFRQLVPRYMQEAPGTAFESGGLFQFVLVNVEEEPTVKVIDLQSVKTIQDLNRRINNYRSQHTYAPVKDMLGNGLFVLDYEKLSYKEAPLAISPYSGNSLPFLYSNTGEIIIDYARDINQVLQESEASEDTDLRPLLYEDAPFVPFHSVPYTLTEDGEPELNPQFEETPNE